MFEDAAERELVEAAGRAPGGSTAKPLAKLAVGILAGVSAVLLPRVLALSAQSDGTQIVFFPTPYFALAAGVGLFIGLVMLVLEYEVAAKPRDTFMAALGIPAIISGALGNASAARPAANSSGLSFPLVASAHAGEPLAQAGGDPVRFGIRVEQPKYVVVLKHAASADAAMQDEKDLRRQLPAARAVRADSGYFVILGGSPTGETEAVLAAARAKKLLGAAVQPVLVEVKR